MHDRSVSEAVRPFICKTAWAPEALVEAGLDSRLVQTWVVDPHRAKPEQARLSLHGRKRTAPTQHYVWGPDLEFLSAAR